MDKPIPSSKLNEASSRKGLQANASAPCRTKARKTAPENGPSESRDIALHPCSQGESTKKKVDLCHRIGMGHVPKHPHSASFCKLPKIITRSKSYRQGSTSYRHESTSSRHPKTLHFSPVWQPPNTITGPASYRQG